MSYREISLVTSPLYRYSFPALVGGGAQGTNIPNLFPSCSQIVGIDLVTSGGTPSTNLFCLQQNSNAGGITGGQAYLYGNNAADTSVYQISWRNVFAQSPFLNIQPC
jgi:hypothetical protein